MALLKRDELGSPKSSDGFRASAALLSKQISKALSAIWFVLTGCEFLTSQNFIAIATSEAITMPWSRFIRDSSFVNHAIAFHTALGVLLFVAWNANNLLVTRDETLIANWLLTDFAAEALFMPLLAFVLVLLHTSAKDVLAAIATGSKVVVMAISAVELLVLGSEWLIDQRILAVEAFEAFLMPMLFFVRQILGIRANGSLAFFA